MTRGPICNRCHNVRPKCTCRYFLSDGAKNRKQNNRPVEPVPLPSMELKLTNRLLCKVCGRPQLNSRGMLSHRRGVHGYGATTKPRSKQ